MDIVLPALVLLLAGSVGLRLYVRRWRDQRTTTQHSLERSDPNDPSLDVRPREDRDRWDQIDLERLHPLNREEAVRLLAQVDADGLSALSSDERLFLNNLSHLRIRS